MPMILSDLERSLAYWKRFQGQYLQKYIIVVTHKTNYNDQESCVSYLL